MSGAWLSGVFAAFCLLLGWLMRLPELGLLRTELDRLRGDNQELLRKLIAMADGAAYARLQPRKVVPDKGGPGLTFDPETLREAEEPVPVVNPGDMPRYTEEDEDDVRSSFG